MNLPDPLLPRTTQIRRDGTTHVLCGCPFCGDAQGLLLEDDETPTWETAEGWVDGREAETFWVSCEDCGAQGPPHDSPARAVEVWNDRVSSLSLQPN